MSGDGLLVGAYRRLAAPMLFRIGGGDPEAAHEWTIRWLGRAGAPLGVLPRRLRSLAVYSPRGGARTVFGVRFPNPVGLAAGVDKDGQALRAWPALGLGFVEVGTVTRHAQAGNERPRMFRLRDSEATINRMGFNNAGAAALASRLASIGPLSVPLGISLGKSRVTPIEAAVGDYVASLRTLYHYGDYFAVNVSSPNTPGLRSLQDRGQLADLLAALRAEAASLAGDGPVRPILVKLAPDLTDHALLEAVEVCLDNGVAGIIATNTTLGRDGLTPGDAASGGCAGGLSGRPLLERSLEVVRVVAKESGLPVVGVGGIMSPDDACRMFDAGASLVQLYTGLIYRGPGLARSTARALARHPR